ncbi:unnamed protein product [Arabidopsis thaliana]|nr:unnamed protein product [Arabidopsis thaliana]
MECNKEEAKRAMYIAERKLSENDYIGAKKFINKAQNLYPALDGLKQVLMMINVYISASNKEGGESDWYGILGVDPLADDETVKKHYKTLTLLLHPDKNRFNGAEGAFKLVLDAWSLLSDKAKRIALIKRENQNKKRANHLLRVISLQTLLLLLRRNRWTYLFDRFGHDQYIIDRGDQWEDIHQSLYFSATRRTIEGQFSSN